MGRASNRKKARRLAGHAPPQASPALRGAAGAQQWLQGSLGDRFFHTRDVAQAQGAPAVGGLDLMTIAGDSAQWPVAVSALIRAVVFDGMRPDHPDVSAVLDVLGPIAEAELAYEAAMERWYEKWPDGEEDKPRFPDLGGPVFRLGGCALVDAVRAVVGHDPLGRVHEALLPVLHDTAESMKAAIPGLNGRALADGLACAAVTDFRRELPADVLRRAGPPSGSSLETLVHVGGVPPREVLRVGLAVLSVLADLCRSDSTSILRRPPELRGNIPNPGLLDIGKGVAWRRVLHFSSTSSIMML
jgi:hypothetical protein